MRKPYEWVPVAQPNPMLKWVRVRVGQEQGSPNIDVVRCNSRAIGKKARKVSKFWMLKAIVDRDVRTESVH